MNGLLMNETALDPSYSKVSLNKLV